MVAASRTGGTRGKEKKFARSLWDQGVKHTFTASVVYNAQCTPAPLRLQCILGHTFVIHPYDLRADEK